MSKVKLWKQADQGLVCPCWSVVPSKTHTLKKQNLGQGKNSLPSNPICWDVPFIVCIRTSSAAEAKVGFIHNPLKWWLPCSSLTKTFTSLYIPFILQLSSLSLLFLNGREQPRTGQDDKEPPCPFPSPVLLWTSRLVVSAGALFPRGMKYRAEESSQALMLCQAATRASCKTRGSRKTT